MYGRYRLSRRKQMIEEYFSSVSGEDDWTPRYNIAPTQPVPVIRQNPKEPRRELSLVRWGLIPSWAKDMSGAAMMINARSETAATKPAFRDYTGADRACSGGDEDDSRRQRRGNVAEPCAARGGGAVWDARGAVSGTNRSRAGTCSGRRLSDDACVAEGFA